MGNLNKMASTKRKWTEKYRKWITLKKIGGKV